MIETLEIDDTLENTQTDTTWIVRSILGESAMIESSIHPFTKKLEYNFDKYKKVNAVIKFQPRVHRKQSADLGISFQDTYSNPSSEAFEEIDSKSNQYPRASTPIMRDSKSVEEIQEEVNKTEDWSKSSIDKLINLIEREEYDSARQELVDLHQTVPSYEFHHNLNPLALYSKLPRGKESLELVKRYEQNVWPQFKMSMKIGENKMLNLVEQFQKDASELGKNPDSMTEFKKYVEAVKEITSRSVWISNEYEEAHGYLLSAIDILESVPNADIFRKGISDINRVVKLVHQVGGTIE